MTNKILLDKQEEEFAYYPLENIIEHIKNDGLRHYLPDEMVNGFSTEQKEIFEDFYSVILFLKNNKAIDNATFISIVENIPLIDDFPDEENSNADEKYIYE